MGSRLVRRFQRICPHAQVMMPVSGDVVLVDFGSMPFGHEQAGMRPAIFVSMMKVVAIVIPLTSSASAERYPGTAIIQPNKANSLIKRSVALVFHLRSIDTRRVLKRLGKLSTKEKTAVNKVIRSIITI